MYTDTLLAYENYLRVNKFSQLYADRYGFLHVLPMRSNAGAGDFLVNFVKDISFMNEINYEKALGKVGMDEKFMSKARNYNIHVSYTEPY